jgi:predicted O-methyltransferase YrrM
MSDIGYRTVQLPAHWLRQLRKRRRNARDLYGAPCAAAAYPFWLIHDWLKWGARGRYIARSRRIPGWMREAEAVALAAYSSRLPADAVIVEIGSFLGGSAIVLAGARKLQRSGQVHCIDPFDASGDPFSAPIYKIIGATRGGSLQQRFAANIRKAGLRGWVVAHPGTDSAIAATWDAPIDMLFLDGDQSPAGARAAYANWAPFLKNKGIIAIHNSASGSYAAGHDGHMRLAMEMLRPPQYAEIMCIGSTTFARKIGDAATAGKRVST